MPSIGYVKGSRDGVSLHRFKGLPKVGSNLLRGRYAGAGLERVWASCGALKAHERFFGAGISVALGGMGGARGESVPQPENTLETPVSFAFLIAVALLPVALIWFLPVIAELMTVLTALIRPSRRLPQAAAQGRPELLFVVPAHNESLLIGDCIRSLAAMSSKNANVEVLVVADNCSDDTAAVARSLGARVLERADPTKPGKPAAIQWVLDRVDLASFDSVTIIDADTTVDESFADALTDVAPLRDKAVQTYNGIGNEKETWLTALGGLLVKVRYEGQFPLKRVAGVNCPMANGMTMGTNLLRRAGWAACSLTENWEMYARWTALGETIDYAPRAKLASQEARSLAQSATQRRRWQAGRWTVFSEHATRILRSSKIGWPQKLDALSELSAPGPVLHASVAALLAMPLFLSPSRVAHVVASVFALSLVPSMVWTAVVLQRQSNRMDLIRALARLPFYAGWRLGVAVLAIPTARRGAWHRSPRHLSEPI